jgi:hypothetical protein
MLKKAVQQAAASEEARRTLRYVEPLSEARTTLADFFSILLARRVQARRRHFGSKLDESFDEMFHCMLRLSSVALKIPIEGKHEYAFPQLHIDIGKERDGFSARNFADLLTEFVAAQCDQVLPQSLHHIDAFHCFGQLTFGRRQHPLQSHHDQIPHNERAHFIGSAAHEFLFKLDDGVTDGVFHIDPLRMTRSALMTNPVRIIGGRAGPNKRNREPFVQHRLWPRAFGSSREGRGTDFPPALDECLRTVLLNGRDFIVGRCLRS